LTSSASEAVLLFAKFFARGKEKQTLRYAQGDMSCRAECSEAKNLVLVAAPPNCEKNWLAETLRSAKLLKRTPEGVRLKFGSLRVSMLIFVDIQNEFGYAVLVWEGEQRCQTTSVTTSLKF
jgi:hypothetical protein